MKKHGFDLISFPFTVWAIEPEGYDGSLGGRIHGEGESGWTNTWNLLKIAD